MVEVLEIGLTTLAPSCAEVTNLESALGSASTQVSRRRNIKLFSIILVMTYQWAKVIEKKPVIPFSQQGVNEL